MEGLDMNANICESKTLNANTFSDSLQTYSHTIPKCGQRGKAAEGAGNFGSSHPSSEQVPQGERGRTRPKANSNSEKMLFIKKWGKQRKYLTSNSSNSCVGRLPCLVAQPGAGDCVCRGRVRGAVGWSALELWAFAGEGWLFGQVTLRAAPGLAVPLPGTDRRRALAHSLLPFEAEMENENVWHWQMSSVIANTRLI